MRRGITTIVGLGIVTALFLAIMSVFYLQQIPTKADLERLSDDVRNVHGLYISSAAKVDVSLLPPRTESERHGVRVSCVLRRDIRQRPEIVRVYLNRIAESILSHPEWRGRLSYVTVAHSSDPEATITREIGEPRAAASPPHATPAPPAPPAPPPAPAPEAPSGR